MRHTTQFRISDDPEIAHQLAIAREALAEESLTAEMIDAAEEVCREVLLDETEVRTTMFEYLDQLSARELEAYVEQKRQQFERTSREDDPDRWSTYGSLLTAGYTMLARYGER